MLEGQHANGPNPHAPRPRQHRATSAADALVPSPESDLGFHVQQEHKGTWNGVAGDGKGAKAPEAGEQGTDLHWLPKVPL